MSTLSQNHGRGRGRGYLINRLLKQRNSLTSSNHLPLKNVASEEIKKNVIYYEKPIRSTYIPPEHDQNDESIYNTGINSGINFNKFNEIDVKVSGKDVPPSIESFETCNFSKELMKNLKKCKFIKPTPIQKHSIPIILSGKDIMAAAQTGSGKTVI